MLAFLNKPYPFNSDLKHNAKIILFISVGVLVYILLFLPIDISSFTEKEITYLIAGITVATFIMLSMNLIVFPSLIPKMFDNSRWTIKREIIWNAWTLISISGIYYILYSFVYGVYIIHFVDLLQFVFLAVIPVSAVIVINYNRLLRNNLKMARQLNAKLAENKQLRERLIDFDSEYKKDNLIVRADSIIMIKSADNYIEVYYEKDGIVKKRLIRSSLSKMENMLKDFSFMFKCHRSYIINLNHIAEIQGHDAQGYKVFFEGIDFPALVSQTYVDAFNNII